MKTTSRKAAKAAAPAKVVDPLKYDVFLEKLSAKDRLNAERHVAACEEEPDGAHAETWRRLACAMMTLASHSAKLNGQQSAQFYVADGKYRMQVFALEDRRDGKLSIYCNDVLDEAMRDGVLASAPAAKGDEDDEEAPAGLEFQINGAKEKIVIERLDSRTENPAPFYKDMLGWNRRAIRVVLPTGASRAQIGAVEGLCATAARAWANAQAAATT